MTETENLLSKAQDIALRAFERPTETAVMEIFRRLCVEADEARLQADAHAGALH